MKFRPRYCTLVALFSFTTSNAADVFVSTEWIKWFMNWSSVESAAGLKDLDNTISIELDTGKACYSVNTFHEYHCYKTKNIIDKNKVCWGDDREAKQCFHYINESAILTLDYRETLVKVRAKSIREFMNQTMISGSYKKDSVDVEFKPDGTLIGIPGISKYSLALRANDTQWEGIQIELYSNKKSETYSIVKINGSLVLREKHCLDDDVDPICFEPLNTNIKYVFKHPLPKHPLPK